MGDIDRPPSRTERPGAEPGLKRSRGGTQLVFDVVGTERLSPQLIRVHLGGDGFDAFMASADPERLAKTDKYVKILFARPELGLEPPYDLDALRETLSSEDLPVRRTYTVRSIDTRARTLAIDFVVHGDEGIAGPWAAAAAVGDRLCFSGPGGQYAPSTEDVEYLFVGDDSAIPAIAAGVEALPSPRGDACSSRSRARPMRSRCPSPRVWNCDGSIVGGTTARSPITAAPSLRPSKG